VTAVLALAGAVAAAVHGRRAGDAHRVVVREDGRVVGVFDRQYAAPTPTALP
jgi:hypothetical protein